MAQIEFEFSLPYRITRRRNWVVADCFPLDICSQGDTEADATRNLTEATQAFLLSCYERGVLEKVLKDCGFTSSRTKTVRPSRAKNLLKVSIPLQFTPQAQCHA